MLGEILPFLAPGLRDVFHGVGRAVPDLEEVRLRTGRAIHLVAGTTDGFLAGDGTVTSDPEQGRYVSGDELQVTFQLVARGSVYAWEEELRGGFITLPGGHRVGLCGRAVVDGGQLRTLQPVGGLNLRVARQLPGVANHLMPYIVDDAGTVAPTLLVSPPQAGKTTVLRDVIRLASYGVPALGLVGQKVVVVDERSELAGCDGGVPQRDLGPRTDVLDGCPKAAGMMLMIRAMSPQLLAVDEIGRREDAEAVLVAALAGVNVIATIHGRSLADIWRRPGLRRLMGAGVFRRAVLLGRQAGPGVVEQVWELPAEWPRQSGRPLLPRPLYLAPVPGTVGGADRRFRNGVHPGAVSQAHLAFPAAGEDTDAPGVAGAPGPVAE